MPVSEQRIELLSQSVEEQKKSVTYTNELLKGLMIGIENLGDNMKNIQKEMDYWRNPEVLETEEDLGCLQDNVPIFVPAEKGTENTLVSVPEDPNSFLARRENCFQWMVWKESQPPLTPRNFQIHLLLVGCRSGYRLSVGHTQELLFHFRRAFQHRGNLI